MTPVGPIDLAQVRLDNALLLFEEFVRHTARHADAATLRGLEKRFAERLQIQPSYWSQIKNRSRQIGERLARQFEHLCHKPRGWMDLAHDASAPVDAFGPPVASPFAGPFAGPFGGSFGGSFGGPFGSSFAGTHAAGASAGPSAGPSAETLGAAMSAAAAAAGAAAAGAPAMGAVRESDPQDDDERFIVGLVLTYYRRHPQRARTRLLDLLGEVLIPSAPPAREAAPPGAAADRGPAAQRRAPAPSDEGPDLWRRTSAGIAPLKHRK